MFMSNVGRIRSLRVGANMAALALAILAVAAVPNTARAQLQVIHAFSGPDGALPKAGLTIRGGKLYGTTWAGHQGTGWGGVYQLRAHNGAWIFQDLHVFDGMPLDRVVFGPNGTLYGTSPSNLVSYYYGYIFNVTAPINVCQTVGCIWPASVIFGFGGGSDGATPKGAALVFDSAGNMYGTTSAGGSGNGTVYTVTPSGVQSVIYAFAGTPDAATPYSGVIFDSAGNLYGVTQAGGASGNGAVYELSPNGGTWTEQVIYSFTGGNDGSNPVGGLVMDGAGDLYGTTASGGTGGGGTVFELSPNGGSWSYNLLNSFSGTGNCGPWAEPAFDTSGNLYGTTLCDGASADGNIWELANSGNGFTYSSLHDFNGSDGKQPYSNVAFDTSGNLYGTTASGGANDLGEVWEFVPQSR
jgi:uncharacterized repeat protein (TIGR03803 family)